MSLKYFRVNRLRLQINLICRDDSGKKSFHDKLRFKVIKMTFSAVTAALKFSN